MQFDFTNERFHFKNYTLLQWFVDWKFFLRIFFAFKITLKNKLHESGETNEVMFDNKTALKSNWKFWMATSTLLDILQVHKTMWLTLKLIQNQIISAFEGNFKSSLIQLSTIFKVSSVQAVYRNCKMQSCGQVQYYRHWILQSAINLNE